MQAQTRNGGAIEATTNIQLANISQLPSGARP